MKRVILLFLVFAGLTFGSCRRQTVMPQFDIVVTDTVAVRGGIPCRFQYAFTSIANADEAPALQAIQESNMLYFFGLEHFQGGGAGGCRSIYRAVHGRVYRYPG